MSMAFAFKVYPRGEWGVSRKAVLLNVVGTLIKHRKWRETEIETAKVVCTVVELD